MSEIDPWSILLQQGPVTGFFGALLLGARNLWTTIRPGVMKILDELYNFMIATKESQRLNSESLSQLTKQHESVVKLVERHDARLDSHQQLLTEIRDAVRKDESSDAVKKGESP